MFFCIFCSVPPVVYKKVKQVSENEREGFLVKELKDILSREGLSTDPSEKGVHYYDIGFGSDPCYLLPCLFTRENNFLLMRNEEVQYSWTRDKTLRGLSFYYCIDYCPFVFDIVSFVVL